MHLCKSVNCPNHAQDLLDFCQSCTAETEAQNYPATQTLAQKYPQYYKPVGDLTEVDVYAVHMLFQVQDPSGCLHHASKKLLLSGVRTGGKSAFKDIKEARDTLNRWIELNPEH